MEDRLAGDTIDLKFNTKVGGVGFTLAGAPVVSIYKDNSTTESTAGVTLTVDIDGRTGMHNVRITTASDGAFYANGSDFVAVITTGTVNGLSAVGLAVGAFSLANRSHLRPTVATRTLDVSAGGEAGLDWANIGSPTTAVNLSATNIDVDQIIASVSGAVGSIAAGGIVAATFAANALDAVWSTAVRLLTAGTNIVLAKGVGVTGFNDLSAAQVNTEADTALSDVGVTATVTGRIDAAMTTRATPAQVNAEVVDALNVDTYAEPGQGLPAATASLVTKLGFLYKAFRNRKTQTSTTMKLYADDAVTVDQKGTRSDDGTTYDEGEVASGP